MSVRSHLIASAFLVCSTTLAFSADIPATYHKPVIQPVEYWNPWMIRVRALAVIPRDSADLSINYGRVDGNLDVSNSVVPELDITYFFTKNIAVELILGTTPHSVKTAGALKSVGKVGSAWLLPPTLTLQYHFDLHPKFKPYIGAGINYTVFYNEKEKGSFETFDLKNDFGWALQVGADYMIDDHWGINFDVKKIFLEVDAKARLNSGALVTGKVKLDPWLIGAGVTYKF